MRHHHLVRVIAPLLLALAPGVAHAQASATAQNTVTVRIPTVLRMSVTQSDTRTAQTAGPQNDGLTPHGVRFHITDGQVTPASVTVQVFSNATWSLSVQETGGSGPDLQYQGCDRTDWTQTVLPSTACSQRPPTGGWLAVPLEVRVAAPAPEGSYTRTLTFTLTRP